MSSPKVSNNLTETPATYWADKAEERADKLAEIRVLVGRYGARARFECNPLCSELVDQLSKVLGIGGAS